MELTLDLSVARAGVTPALNLQHSFTKNADLLLNDQQKEGLSLIRPCLDRLLPQLPFRSCCP